MVTASSALQRRRPAGLLARAAARVAQVFGLGASASAERLEWERQLRRMVINGRAVGLRDEEIVDLLAERLYQRELLHGAGEADIGLVGPRLFRREAAAIVARATRHHLRPL